MNHKTQEVSKENKRAKGITKERKKQQTQSNQNYRPKVPCK